MAKDSEFIKNLKSPDSFQKTVAGIVNWIVLNQAMFFGSLVVILLIFGAILGFQYWRDSQVTSRQEALAAIDFQYSKEEEEANKKRSEVAEKISGTKPGSEAAVDPSKQEQIRKAVETIKADHVVSMEQYRKFYEAHKDVNEGWLAGMRYAGHLLENKKLTEAKPILEHILEKSKHSEFHQMHVGFVYANILVEEKDFDRALQQTDMLIGIAPDALKPQVYLLRARILLAKGDKESAQKALDALIKDHANSPEAQKAKSMKAVLH